MNGMKKTQSDNIRRLKFTGITVSVLLVVLIFSASVNAWFYFGRKAAGITEIVNPAAIFINAGNEEDIRYLDLGNIDLSEDPNKNYKDFVFCVRGDNIPQYRMQLAYTTNNQFDFEIYAASQTNGTVPAGNTVLVTYKTHSATPETMRYYVPENASPLAGSFLNKDTGAAEKLAKDDDTYFDMTYTPSGAATAYSHYHSYAVPLYWQTNSSVATGTRDEFTHYYILRVIWNQNAQNTKETDIIYITAKNTAADA